MREYGERAKLKCDRTGESGAEAAFGNAECELKLSKRDRM